MAGEGLLEDLTGQNNLAAPGASRLCHAERDPVDLQWAALGDRMADGIGAIVAPRPVTRYRAKSSRQTTA